MKRFACVLFFATLAVCQSPDNKGIPVQHGAGNSQPSGKANQNKQDAETPSNQTIAIYEESRPAENEHNHQQDREQIEIDRKIAKFTGYLAGVGLLQFVVLVVQAILFFQQKKIMGQHKTSLEQLATAAATNAGISAKTLVLTQRPRIVVRAFYFSEIKGVGGITKVSNRIEAGSFCTGQYYIENCGGTDARIREIYSEVFITDKLPMMRPYEGKEGSKEEKTLRPGTSTFYLFGRMEPLGASDTSDLNTPIDAFGARLKYFYVLGWIGYTDDLGIYRMTAFCRRYDATKDRFVPVDDADYEYAD
jgi:hypothetical protein